MVGTGNQQFFLSKNLTSNFTFSLSITFNNSGLTFDITHLVKEIKSITYRLNHFASAEIILLDKEKRLFNQLYIGGAHHVSIMINDMTNNILYFYGIVKSFHPVDIQNDLYTMELWSYFGYHSERKVKKGFVGKKTVSEILQELLSDKKLFGNIGDKYFIEPCNENDKIENFIIPQWSLYQTIQYLKQFALTKSGDIFLFFEDITGLNFVSKYTFLHTFKNRPIMPFKFTIAQNSDENDINDNSLEERVRSRIPMNVIYNYEFIRGYDIDDHFKADDFSNQIYVFDYENKTMKTLISDITKIIDKVYTLYKYTLFDSETLSYFRYNNNAEYREFPHLQNQFSMYHIQKNMMQDMKLKFETNGMLFLQLGQFLQIDIPGLIETVDGLSGIWITGQITHRIQVSTGQNRQLSLTTTIVAVRDSINIDDSVGKASGLLSKKQLVAIGS